MAQLQAILQLLVGTNNVQTSGSIEAGSATLTSDLTVGGNFVIGSESISESTIGSINGVTLGQSANGKVVTQGLTGDINLGTSNGSNIIKVLSHNGVDAGLQLGSTLVEATATDLNKLSGITDGQVTAEKAIVVDSSSDIVGINNITSTGKITSQEQETINSTITNGLKLDVATKSFSDATKAIILDSGIDGDQIYTNTSAGAGSVVDATDIYSLRGATLASTLTSVTTTNASTLHVKGAPSAGNNMTLTNANALRVSGGNTLLEGDINVSGSSVFGGDVTFNGQMTTNSGMTINGSITGGSDSTLADIKFTVEK